MVTCETPDVCGSRDRRREPDQGRKDRPPPLPAGDRFRASLESWNADARTWQLPRLDRSRHNGGPLLRAPRTEDGRPVSAGLLAHGSKRLAPAFPQAPVAPAVAFVEQARRLQLRGQPRWYGLSRCPVFPFHPRPPEGVRGNRYDALISRARHQRVKPLVSRLCILLLALWRMGSL